MSDLLTRDELAYYRETARLGITRELLAHIDALEAALKATYNGYLKGWFSSDDTDVICNYCGARYSWREDATTHKPDCKGEALKATLGLGEDASA